MATLTLRAIKGSPLTNTEVDNNFSNLNDDKVEKNGDTLLTGKLKLVAGDASKASVRLTAGSANPSSPESGDLWNNAGVLKYYNGTSTGNVITSLDGQSFVGDVTVGDELTVTGNLVVNGTTTTINSTNVLIQDNNITLGNVGTPTDVTANLGGITLKGTTDKTFRWVSANNNFVSSENIDIATGKTFKINNTNVLSATTLGTGVVNSSLTSVGTIVTGVWNGSAVPVANGGTGATSAGDARTNLSLGTGNNVQFNNMGVGVAAATSGTGRLDAASVILTETLKINDVTKGITSADDTLVAIVKNSGLRFTGVGIGVDPTSGEFKVGSSITGVASTGALSVASLTVSTGDIAFSTATGKGLKDSQGDLNLEVRTDGIKITSLGVGTNSSGTAGEIRAANEITAYYASDARLKENVITISDALTKLEKINGVEFDWSQQHIDNRGGEDGYFVRKHDVGVIAQQIEEILPEAVATRDDGYKAVRYEKIVPLLIEAIKDLNKQVQELKNNAQ